MHDPHAPSGRRSASAGWRCHAASDGARLEEGAAACRDVHAGPLAHRRGLAQRLWAWRVVLVARGVGQLPCPRDVGHDALQQRQRTKRPRQAPRPRRTATPHAVQGARRGAGSPARRRGSAPAPRAVTALADARRTRTESSARRTANPGPRPRTRPAATPPRQRPGSPGRWCRQQPAPTCGEVRREGGDGGQQQARGLAQPGAGWRKRLP